MPLRESDEQFRFMVESAGDAIVAFDGQGAVVYWNQAAESAFGYTAAEMAGKSVVSVVSDRGRQVLQEQTNRLDVGGRPDAAGNVMELTGLRKDGAEFPAEVSIGMRRVGDEVFFTAIVRDVTLRKQYEQQIAYLADHDSLTGLPNRRLLEESLKRVVARAHRGNVSTILFLDADNFKAINDTVGHAAGDESLIILARLLREQLRAYDLVARLGGDEFAVLLEGTSAQEAMAVAERIRRAIESHCFLHEGMSFNLTLSIGVAAITRRESAQIVLSQADAAMYAAKEQGGNRTVVYRQNGSSNGELTDAGRVVKQLKEALKECLFVLHYQPVVNLQDGKIAYYEALIRLRKGENELVFPGSFVTAAERLGLISQLTRWVVTEAVHTLQRSPAAHLTVNLSALDLFDDSLPKFVQARLRESGVNPDRLGFEISETAVMKDMVLAEGWMRRLKEIGCRVVLDDFGTGFVSFIYLRNLPVDQIKIDISFIRAMETDPAQRALVNSIQLLARALGKETVAEGVETEASARAVKDMGVTFAQGFYFGKPRPELACDAV